EAEIAFTDSALRSAYRSAGSMNLSAKKFQKRRCRVNQTTPYHSPGSTTRCGVWRGGVFVVREELVSPPAGPPRPGGGAPRRAPGERHQAAGANPYALAYETFG